MAPFKPPKTLFELSVKSCVYLIHTASINIKANAESCDYACEKMAKSLRETYLMSILPARLFDILCSERTCCTYTADPCLQLLILFHPNLSIFRKCDRDYIIPQQFWITNLPQLQRLVILDLKFICTDEILRIISENCLHLQEINIVSRVNICKSPFNACVLVRNVSDNGLDYVAKLKQLRILAMDLPQNGRAMTKERYVSQAGIVRLVNQLPHLVELKIESCDIGSTLISSDFIIGPLNLQKINCHFASANGVQKLIKICPFLKEFTFTHVTEYDKDEILNAISSSDLRLSKLDLSFFSYSPCLQHLLIVKGQYLTQFSLCEIVNSLNIDALVMIGTHCPNLELLGLITQSKLLDIPAYFKLTRPIFTHLKNLIIGNGSFNIDQVLLFFFNYTQNIQKLVVKYESKVNMDGILIRLLKSNKLSKLVSLWLDCTLGVSKDVVKQLIDNCIYLQTFTVDFQEDMSDIQYYIQENNLDLKLDGGY